MENNDLQARLEKIEQALRQEQEKNKELSLALSDALNATKAKSDFLARMSHEIRTPMNAIIGEATIAQKSISNQSKVAECLEKVQVSSKHLLNLINDILDMSAIESNKMKIATSEFDIKDVVSTVTTLYYSQCKQKGITFEAKLDNVLTEILVGDQLRIQQVILNLLSNAYKFTEPGGRIVFGLAEETTDTNRVVLHIQVKDTGKGMSKEYLQHIFRPFEQETALTARDHGGSGLGLSITKNLVELMGGKIDVASTLGQGTTFSLTIECVKAASQINIDKESISSMRAIIIEDESISMEYTRGILNHIGIRSDGATSGEEALNLITKARNDKVAYDFCLIDWKLSGMDGLELTRKIRQACGEHPVVIVASAYELEEIGEDMQECGVDAYLPKPLFQSTVFNVLMSISKGKLINKNGKPEEYDFTNKRLLLVDDTPINREIAQELLELVNFKVETAQDGREAIDMFEASAQGYYDAILMDVQMPVMNGYEATRMIRESKHPEAKSICIIAMTANAFAEDIAKSLEAGMDDHISKPIDTELMYEVLARYLGKAADEENS